jgi:hypothetical protein
MHAMLAAVAVSFVLQRLELNLIVNYDAQRIDGTALMTVKNASAAPADAVPLLLGRLMRFKELKQEVVTFDDDDTRQFAFASLPLPKPLAPGESTTITVPYGGHIVGYTETGMLYVKDHVSEDFTVIRNDAYSFPTLGVPSLKAMRARPRGDFTFDLRVDVPSAQVVAAGGVLVDKQDHDGRSTYHFASEIPTPFLYITIAKYKVLEQNGVRIYYLPAEESGAAAVMQKTQKSLALYESWLGPLPQRPHLTIQEIPDGYGEQGHPVGGITIDAYVFHEPDSLVTLYHEVGHLWNAPDADVATPRLNEGLSMWFQDIVAEAVDEKPASWLAPRLLTKLAKAAATDGRLARVPLRDYGRENMTDWSYSVGYFYFRALEKKIGRPALLAVLRDFYGDHRPKTLQELVTLLERKHPETRPINAAWIETTAWTAKVAQAANVEALLASE